MRQMGAATRVAAPRLVYSNAIKKKSMNGVPVSYTHLDVYKRQVLS